MPDPFMVKSCNMWHSHNKRAKKVGKTLDYTLEEFRNWLKNWLDLPCPYCGVVMNIKSIETDHKEPICRGGSFNGYNVEFICKDCNKAKSALSQAEFALLMDTLRDFGPQARQNVLCRLRAGARAGRF